MTEWDAPNQQVVRADQSAPWEEGTGGAAPEPGPTENGGGDVALDAMTKAELLAYAQSIGVSPANNDMTKDEIRDGINAKQAGGT